MSRMAVFLRWFSLFLIISWLAISLPPSPAGASQPSPTRAIASQREVGRAVHPGTPADIQSAFSPSLSWTATGENVDDAFGFSVATAGDVNGDGYADVLIGGYTYPAGAEQGKVYLYLGSPSGLPSTPDWTETGENASEWFGISVTTAGDVNGDG